MAKNTKTNAYNMKIIFNSTSNSQRKDQTSKKFQKTSNLMFFSATVPD